MATDSGDKPEPSSTGMRSFLASLSTMTGDLSNITAPSSVLDSTSTVEMPAFWAEDPSVFCAPARSEDPAERALLALKTFLSGLRAQCYRGQNENEGVKKPLNSFLGELFIARWEDDNDGVTQMVSEQVSHHPPITACRIWNEKHGISAESYNQSSIAFTGSVHIEAAGSVLKTISKYDEHYLLPIPDLKVTSLLSTPSPELTGTYYIPSTTDYMSVVHFTEKGFFGGSSKKHNFEAHVYLESESEDKPIYTVKGSWFDTFTIHDCKSNKDLETVNVKTQIIDKPTNMIVEPIEQQDPWESRKAWEGVQKALARNDTRAVTEGKTRLEDGQRAMRAEEEQQGRAWQPLFFESFQRNTVLEKLMAKIPTKDARKSVTESGAGWTLNMEKWKSTKKPYHGDLLPDNTRTGSQTADPASAQSERRSEGQPLHQFDDGIDHKVGAVDDGRPAEADGVQIDIGQEPEKKHIEGITMNQPGPQAAQISNKEAYEGSGIEGMSLKEKQEVEDMLRDQYSTGNDERDYVRRKKHQSKD